MKRVVHFGTTLFLLMGCFANAQNIVWTGAANSDFFNEANWKDSVTNAVPASGTINPSQNIDLALQINVTAAITGGVIQFGTGSLAIGKATITATSLSGGNVTVSDGYINLSAASPLLNSVQINFTSGIGWIRTTNYSTTSVSTTNLGQIKVNGGGSVYGANLRLDNYYLNGCVIRSNVSSTSPLTVYDGINALGNPGLIPVNTIHSGSAIPSSMNNKIKSFILKKGFMVTFATETDGTGKSKNYIASEADMTINSLPKTLLNSISFIRVLPWNWVTKKGRTQDVANLNSTWRYSWSSVPSSTVDTEFTPMAWGWSSAEDADIATFVGKYNSTHTMGFNEPDSCTGQSGQYTPTGTNNKTCVTDVAVAYYRNLMKTGMRLVSPGCTEGAALSTGWLKEFSDKATAQDVRIDVIAVHWYDYGNNPQVGDSDTGAQIFARFQTYLTTVHDLYGLPIWITEFNANPARSAAVNLAFMQLALPYLETLSYVERYNWFYGNETANFYTTFTTPWVNGAQIFTPGTVLGDAGNFYKNQVSTPSITDATVYAANNLNLATCKVCP